MLVLGKFLRAQKYCWFVPSHACCWEFCNNPDYRDKLLELQDQHRCLMGAWGTATELNLYIVDLTAMVNPMESRLRNHTTSSGGPLWTVGDEVHMKREAGRHNWGDSSQRQSRQLCVVQRKQSETIVTLPARPQHKCVRHAGLLPGYKAWWTEGDLAWEGQEYTLAEHTASGGGLREKAGEDPAPSPKSWLVVLWARWPPVVASGSIYQCVFNIFFSCLQLANWPPDGHVFYFYKRVYSLI